MTNKHHPVLIFYRFITSAFQRMPFVFILSIGAVPIMAQEASIDQAVSWYQAGENSRAREIFLQIIKDQPEHPVALYHLGRLETAHPAAEQYYLQVLLHAPQHTYADDALLAVMRLQYQQGRYQEAVKACSRLLASYPKSDLKNEVRYWQGRALLANKQPALARLTFLQLLTVAPESTFMMPTRLGIADTYRAESDFIEAARLYLKFETDFPDSDSLRIALLRAGESLEASSRTKEAGHVYQRLINRFPDSPEAGRVR
jgi:TolA-binding protein